MAYTEISPRAPRFTSAISLGNILTIVTMGASAVALYGQQTATQALHEQRIGVLEKGADIAKADHDLLVGLNAKVEQLLNLQRRTP